MKTVSPHCLSRITGGASEVSAQGVIATGVGLGAGIGASIAMEGAIAAGGLSTLGAGAVGVLGAAGGGLVAARLTGFGIGNAPLNDTAIVKSDAFQEAGGKFMEFLFGEIVPPPEEDPDNRARDPAMFGP